MMYEIFQNIKDMDVEKNRILSMNFKPKKKSSEGAEVMCKTPIGKTNYNKGNSRK